jgi:hypothetical protein
MGREFFLKIKQSVCTVNINYNFLESVNGVQKSLRFRRDTCGLHAWLH